MIDTGSNTWQDLGTGASGGVVEFVCAYLESCDESNTVVDALLCLTNMMMPPASVLYLSGEQPQENMQNYSLKSVYDLEHPSLIQTLKNKGINLAIAKQHLKEVLVKDATHNRVICAIGAGNAGNGYEFWNDFVSGYISPKNISFVRSKKFPARHIHIFEKYFDFLSALSYDDFGVLEGDVIILNSIACLPQIYPYINSYGYSTLYSWLGNNLAGSRATQSLREFCLRQSNLSLKPMNKKYAPHRGVNKWHLYNQENK